MRIGDLLRTLFGKLSNASHHGAGSTRHAKRSTGNGLPAEAAPVPSCWCLVGNISAKTRRGEDSREIEKGTKHFSPGTKVYCLPALWGDGYEKIVVIGRHRGSKRFVRMVIRADWVTNWRAKVVYESTVIRLIKGTGQSLTNGWDSKEQVEFYVTEMKQREGKPKEVALNNDQDLLWDKDLDE